MNDHLLNATSDYAWEGGVGGTPSHKVASIIDQ